jgi:hypothetical protein
VTGALHLADKAPAGWFAKKQTTVETATCRSEFVATRAATEQIIDLRTTLRCLGVPIRKKSHMFGDNESIANSAATPHAKLHKRHNALSFHPVREAAAGKFIAFHWVGGSLNPADTLSKHWGHQAIWPLLQALLLSKFFCVGSRQCI